MLTAQIQELFATNRKTEKPYIHFGSFCASLNENQYTNLIMSVMTYCEELVISKHTTFIAKVYIDIVLSKSNVFDDTELLKISLCCVWMAVKCYEPERLSTGFSPQILCQHGNNLFSVEDITSLEIYIFKQLDYSLIYTTPYDYLPAFIQTFPWLSKIQQGISQTIELVLTVPQLSCENSQNIFYASFLALCQVKGVELSEFQRNIVLSQVSQSKKVQILTNEIVIIYSALASDELDEAEVEDPQKMEVQ